MRLLDFCANDLIHTMLPIAAGSHPPVQVTRQTLKRPEVRVVTEQITMTGFP